MKLEKGMVIGNKYQAIFITEVLEGFIKGYLYDGSIDKDGNVFHNNGTFPNRFFNRWKQDKETYYMLIRGIFICRFIV